MAKKETREEFYSEANPMWAIFAIFLGVLWIAEHYAKLDFPITACLLVLLGLYYLIKSKI